MLAVPVSVAANNQGLRWVGEVGNQFEFSFTLIRNTSCFSPVFCEELCIENEAMYMEIDSLLPIPDNLQFFEEIPSPEVSLYYKNGTILSLSDFMMMFPQIGKQFILPVGNWHLLTALPSNATTTTTTITTTATTGNFESTQIDNLTHWGWLWSFSDSQTQQEGIHAYYKADGVLGYYTRSIVSDTELVTISFIRLNPPDPVPPAIGIIELGIVIGGVTAVVVIVVMKRKT